MLIQLKLDADLANEMEARVMRDGLDWDTLPLVFRMRYLEPVLAKQMRRENRLVKRACSEQS
jgi:hypothetical protein